MVPNGIFMGNTRAGGELWTCGGRGAVFLSGPRRWQHVRENAISGTTKVPSISDARPSPSLSHLCRQVCLKVNAKLSILDTQLETSNAVAGLQQACTCNTINFQRSSFVITAIAVFTRVCAARQQSASEVINATCLLPASIHFKV